MSLVKRQTTSKDSLNVLKNDVKGLRADVDKLPTREWIIENFATKYELSEM